MTTTAATVDEYLAGLPEDRRTALSAVRETVLKYLPEGYEEGMQYGMIGYFVPHSIFPAGYHCDPKQPLNFAGIGNQKNHMALYLMCIYGSDEQRQLFEDAWAATGKKLDMGKACLRFKKLEDLSLEVIGEAIARISVEKYLAKYLELLSSQKSRKK
jgi:hypothetical protein